MAKTGWLFLNLNANHFADGGGDEVDIFLDGSGGLTSTASGIGIDALGVTNGMLAGSITTAKLVDGAEFIQRDGSVPFTADQPMGSNKITGLAAGTVSTDAINLGQLQGAIAGLQWKDPVYTKDYIGTRTVTEINALTPAAGLTVVAGSAGTPSAGTSDALAIGDVAEFDGTDWKLVLANSGGFVPDGTCLLVHDETVTLFSPLTDGTDESKIAEFDGASNTPSALVVPVDGDALLVNGDGTVNENKGYVFDTNQTPDAWIQFTGAGGAVTPHASTHIRGGTDEIDGDLLDIDATPDNYTPTTAATGGQSNPASDVDELAAHLIGIDNALGAVNPTVPAPYWHTITAGEVTNGYITLTSTPATAGKVSVHPEGGPVQINKQTMAGGMTGDYDVGVDGAADRLSINNNGLATALSGDINIAGLNLYIVFEG